MVTAVAATPSMSSSIPPEQLPLNRRGPGRPPKETGIIASIKEYIQKVKDAIYNLVFLAGCLFLLIMAYNYFIYGQFSLPSFMFSSKKTTRPATGVRNVSFEYVDEDKKHDFFISPAFLIPIGLLVLLFFFYLFRFEIDERQMALRQGLGQGTKGYRSYMANRMEVDEDNRRRLF